MSTSGTGKDHTETGSKYGLSERNGPQDLQGFEKNGKIHGDPLRLHRRDPAKRHLLHHHTGTSGSVSGSDSQGAGRPNCPGKGAVFLMQIGGRLSNGEPHDGRAPDYDDWSTVAETDRSD